jgi:predicted DNA-binding transcriptional regulator AlpA
MSHNPDDYYDIEGAAQALGVKRRTLQDWRCKGTGPNYCKPTPRLILYPKSAIADWIAACTRSSTAQEHAKASQ